MGYIYKLNCILIFMDVASQCTRLFQMVVLSSYRKLIWIPPPTLKQFYYIRYIINRQLLNVTIETNAPKLKQYQHANNIHIKMPCLITLLHGTEKCTPGLYQFIVSNTNTQCHLVLSSYRIAPPSATWRCPHTKLVFSSSKFWSIRPSCTTTNEKPRNLHEV